MAHGGRIRKHRTTTTPELEAKPLEQELLPAKLTLALGPVSECSSRDSASIALEIQYTLQCTKPGELSGQCAACSL